MSTLAPPPKNPSQIRRISHWLNQSSRHRVADAFSPPTPPLSRASSISSSIVSPAHSPSVRDLPRSRAPAQPSAQYLSSIPFYPTGPGPMPINTAMHSVSQTQATHHPSTNGLSYQATSSHYPSTARSHRSPTIHAPTTTHAPTTAHISTSSHTRSRSMSRAPPPISIPEDYTPVSPPSGSANRSHRSGSRHGDERGRSLSRSLHHSHAENTVHGTRNFYSTTGPTSHHTTSNPTSWYNQELRHRSASQHPPVTESFRPAYHRKRSRSYDPPPVSAPTHHNRHYYDNYDRDRGRASAYSGIASAHSQGSSGIDSSNYRMVHASPTSPTLVHPSNTQPVMIPLNDGRDGWVLIPAKGQQFKVVDPSKKSRSNHSPKKSEGQSFFGKLKGLGQKNKDHKDERKPHERVVTIPPENPSHYRRHRRGSY